MAAVHVEERGGAGWIDLHQHRWELHFQGLGLPEGIEAKFQQVAHQLQQTDRGAVTSRPDSHPVSGPL